MVFDVADVRVWIVDALESNADWRSRKADEYPDDERNLDAVADSRRLRDEVAALPASAFEGLLRHVNSREDDGRFDEWCQHQNEVIGGIGFRHFPENAVALLEELGGAPVLRAVTQD